MTTTKRRRRKLHPLLVVNIVRPSSSTPSSSSSSSSSSLPLLTTILYILASSTISAASIIIPSRSTRKTSFIQIHQFDIHIPCFLPRSSTIGRITTTTPPAKKLQLMMSNNSHDDGGGTTGEVINGNVNIVNGDDNGGPVESPLWDNDDDYADSVLPIWSFGSGENEDEEEEWENEEEEEEETAIKNEGRWLDLKNLVDVPKTDKGMASKSVNGDSSVSSATIADAYSSISTNNSDDASTTSSSSSSNTASKSGKGAKRGGTTIHPNEEPPITATMDNTMVAVLASSVTNTDSMDGIVTSPLVDGSAINGDGQKEEEMGAIETIIRNFLGRNDDDNNNNNNNTVDGSVSGGKNRTENNEESEESRKWSEWMTSGRKERRTDVVEVNDLSSSFEGEDYSATGGIGGGGNDAASGDTTSTSSPSGSSSSSGLFSDKLSPNIISLPGGKLLQKTIEGEQQKRIKKDIIKEEKKLLKQQLLLEKQLKKEQKQLEQNLYRDQREREPGRVAANDWSHNIQNFPNSTIFRDVQQPVACVFVWATAWSVIHRFMTRAASKSILGNFVGVSEGAAWFATNMCVPTVPHSMMVSAMSFLLVFRTNSAYQRFAEGRKIWEDIVTVSRDLSRMIKLYESAIGTPKCRRINKLLASFPYLLRHRIRPSLLSLRRVDDPNIVRDPEHSLLLYPDVSIRDTDPEVAALAYDEEETGSSRRKTRELCWVDKRTLPWKLLPGRALELCARAQNRPLWVCDRMAKELVVVEDVSPAFTNRERMTLIGHVDKLSRCIGACERIHQTVVPLNYARHALRSLTVWLWTLPFGLVKDLGLLTGPVVAIVSWILFGVYEIGTRIEDPFQGTLRLSIYCDAIRRDVLADAIVRDTAFELDDEDKPSGDEEYEDNSFFEGESESEEYDGDEFSVRQTEKKKQPKKGGLGWSF